MNVKEMLSEKIAGEITLSPKPGETIRKWRTAFEITQTQLAQQLGISPSVISDYESGRRKSPGITTIKRIIDALLLIDHMDHNDRMIKKYQFISKNQSGILEIMEYPYSISVQTFKEEIQGKLLTKKAETNRQIKGFTLIDGVETIKTMNSRGYSALYGWNTERALVFTQLRYGRSPMIAIRVHPVKPSVIVYHDPGAIDPLALQLAESDNIPLMTTHQPLHILRQKLLDLGK